MPRFTLLVIFILVLSKLGFSQRDSVSYNQFLREIMKMKSISKIFPNDSIFDNTKFIKYIKDSFPGVDSIEYTKYKGSIGWTTHKYDSDYYFGIRKLYVFDTSKYYIIYFQDLNQFIGPEWWFYSNGKIMRKRTGNETEIPKGKGSEPRNYYEERYRRNGKLKFTGEYKNNHKVNTWTYYNRKGKKTKEHIYNY